MTKEEMEEEISNSRLAIKNLRYKENMHIVKIRFMQEEIMKIEDVSQS